MAEPRTPSTARTMCGKCLHPMHWHECPLCNGVCRNDESTLHPITPQSLAQLAEAVAHRHQLMPTTIGMYAGKCIGCGEPWPCIERLLATALSVENVAAGLGVIGLGIENVSSFGNAEQWLPDHDLAAALLEAIGASHD